MPQGVEMGAYNRQLVAQREKFVQRLTAEGFDESLARLILRHSTTLQRFAAAQCNGDWPFDNGQRHVKFCSVCEGGCSPSAMVKGVCPDCRVSARVKALCEDAELPVQLSGDPRGAVVKVKLPSERGDCFGDPAWLCVPTPNF